MGIDYEAKDASLNKSFRLSEFKLDSPQSSLMLSGLGRECQKDAKEPGSVAIASENGSPQAVGTGSAGGGAPASGTAGDGSTNIKVEATSSATLGNSGKADSNIPTEKPKTPTQESAAKKSNTKTTAGNLSANAKGSNDDFPEFDFGKVSDPKPSSSTGAGGITASSTGSGGTSHDPRVETPARGLAAVNPSQFTPSIQGPSNPNGSAKDDTGKAPRLDREVRDPALAKKMGEVAEALNRERSVNEALLNELGRALGQTKDPRDKELGKQAYARAYMRSENSMEAYEALRKDPNRWEISKTIRSNICEVCPECNACQGTGAGE